MDFKEEKGAIIVEATISLTAFIFMIIMILSIINICYVQAKIGIAIHETAKDISIYSYIYGLTGLNESRTEFASGGAESKQKIDNTLKGMTAITNSVANLKDGIGEVVNSDSAESAYQNLDALMETYGNDSANITSSAAIIQEQVEAVADDPKEFIIGSFKYLATEGINAVSSRLIAAPLAKMTAKSHLKDGPDGSCEAFLKQMGVVPKDGSYLKGMDFTHSTLFNPEYVEEGGSMTAKPSDKIEIIAVYKVKVLKLLPVDITLNFCQRAVTKGWFGVEEATG